MDGIGVGSDRPVSCLSDKTGKKLSKSNMSCYFKHLQISGHLGESWVQPGTPGSKWYHTHSEL